MLEVKKVRDTVTMLASAARTVTAGTNSDDIHLPVMVRGFVFTLAVTNAETDNADTLNVKIQTKADGANWLDVVHFTQVLGDGANVVRYAAKVSAIAAQGIYSADAALNAGDAARQVIGDVWRVNWVIVDADADASFTFAVTACPM